MRELSIILIAVLLGAAGQIGLKYGAVRLPGSGTLFYKAMVAWPIWIGLFLYGLSTIFWIYALRTVELSYAYPLLSLGYVLVFAASYFLFNESIGSMRLTGLLFILAGIVLVSRS